MGETVEARYKNGSQYYKGNIVSVNSNGTYDIRYDDGDEERNVSAYKIRRKAGAASHQTKGRRRRRGALDRGREKYYKGKISRDRMDGTYDINYDDGEKELRVEERLIRKLADDSISPRPSDSFREGDKVEARYRGREKYYPGKISRDRGDGTYDIAYDDGERETRVEAKLIRSKDGGGSSDKLREGDEIEARYRGREKYYKGTISRDRGDGTYDISYDDGEKETRVEERLIRKRERGSSRSRSRGADDRLSEGDKVEADYRAGQVLPRQNHEGPRRRHLRHFLRRRRARDPRREAPDPENGEAARTASAKATRSRRTIAAGASSTPVKLVGTAVMTRTTSTMMMESARLESRSASSGPRRARAEARSSRKGTRSRRDIAAGRSITREDHEGPGRRDLRHCYDDGERETRVEERLIKKKDGGGGSDSFREGDKIEADYRGRGKFYPGKISRDRGDDTYDIDYDDGGEAETRVSKRLIRSKDGGGSSSDKFEEGDKVEARYRGREKYYPGKITRDRGDGTYDISYDDGERETRVEERLIRKKDRDRSRSRSRGGDDRLSEGDKVEADYRGRGKFYKGKISRDRGDDTYDIAYDDGERELRVAKRLIRKLDGGSSDSFREGDKVEADYRGRGKFYKGKISRDRGDDTYDIAYDDGEREIRVSKRLIRKLDGGSRLIPRGRQDRG